MKRLEGKVALVTGAGRGIGHGVARCLAADGAALVIVDLPERAAEANSVVAEVQALGSEALFLPADVSNRAAVAAAMQGTLVRFGKLDIAVANAAMSIREPVVKAEWPHVLRTLEVTQFGVFHTCQLAAQQMVQQPLTGRSRGKIVVIGSVHEEMSFPNSGAYNMAKAAVNHLMRTMAAELAAERINVNAINPGWINTPGERKFYSEEELAEAGKSIPWGRIGQPDDIGKAVAFLVSDDADYITGTVLRVDGGFMVGLTLPGSVQ